MTWGVIYVLGTGAYCWFALPWMLRHVGPPNGKANEMEQWASVGLTLLQALFWPFFVLVALAVLAGREGSKR